ncbi:UNVERIFIED_CONTAM: hypothetical protein RMT77_003514 [Armadillidium vulgare]
MFSILALTTSNILLTLRLLRTRGDESGSCDMTSSYASKAWTSKLNEKSNTSYLEFLKQSYIAVRKKDVMRTGSRIAGSSYVWKGLNFTNMYEIGTLFIIDPRLGRFDNRRMFKTFDNIFVGPDYLNLVEFCPVCLATQSSVDRLFWLTQVAKHWEGAPISIAIFTPDIEYGIARAYLQYLITCFPYFGKKVTIHFTFPVQFPPKDINFTLNNLVESCDQPIFVLKELLKRRSTEMLKWRETLQYPQNLLRNVARKNCGTQWVFLTDVDIIPIPHLAQDLSVFLQTKEAKECQTCAFVIPTYEVHELASFPHSRELLLDLVKIGRARPFHQKVFVYNQHATNFSRWEAREKLYPDEKTVKISHDVTSFEFFYEPFYVARDNVPPHDERFLGYGFTRNTQVYEMHIAGYTFKVLSPIFTLHWGMQVKKGRPSWRERQNNANRKLFEGFKREVFAKYQRDPLGMMDKNKRKKG